MLCGSGLKAVAIAAQMIRAGDVDVVRRWRDGKHDQAPYLMPAARFGGADGFDRADRFDGARRSPTRSMTFTWVSGREPRPTSTGSPERNRRVRGREPNRAERATRTAVFKDEVVPVEVPDKRGSRLVDVDEHPRPGTTAETLGRLRAAFRRENGR